MIVNSFVSESAMSFHGKSIEPLVLTEIFFEISPISMEFLHNNRTLRFFVRTKSVRFMPSVNNSIFGTKRLMSAGCILYHFHILF